MITNPVKHDHEPAVGCEVASATISVGSCATVGVTLGVAVLVGPGVNVPVGVGVFVGVGVGVAVTTATTDVGPLPTALKFSTPAKV